MDAAKHSRVRSSVTFLKGVWQVVIFLRNHTEHRSFPTEAEARAYEAARMEHLRRGKPKTQEDDASP